MAQEHKTNAPRLRICPRELRYDVSGIGSQSLDQEALVLAARASLNQEEAAAGSAECNCIAFRPCGDKHKSFRFKLLAD